MSAHNLPVALSPEARQDLRDIEVYTLLEWGAEQWQIYEDRLWKSLMSLGNAPHQGRPRDELALGYRSLVVERHVIFYQVLSAQVSVVRILNGRMDARRALRRKP